jgi:hypothetical protein
MMADRKRLAALVLAQCAAFAAVLILAAFSGPGHSTQSTSSSPSDVTFTVTAKAEHSQTATGSPSPASFQNRPVVTLDAENSKKPVVSGRLNAKNSARETVPAKGPYLVCLSPPQGWESADIDTYRLPGWICKYLPDSVADKTVTFTLMPGAGEGIR